MTNKKIAKILRDVAAAYELLGEDFFKIRAYKTAADAVEQSSVELKELHDMGKLQSIPGIGASIAQHLDELFKKGKSDHFERVLKKLPGSIYQLLEIPGVGAKTAAKLVRELKLVTPEESIDELEKAAKEGKIAKIDGFGDKSENELLGAIERYRKSKSKEKRFLLPFATAIADSLVDYMRKCLSVERVDTLGSLRRQAGTVGDVDIAVATNNPSKVIQHFTAYKNMRKVIAAGKNTARLIDKNGVQIDLKTERPESYGSLLQHYTGSKEHNISLREYAIKLGLSVSEHGIKEVKRQKAKGKTAIQNSKVKRFKSEEEFYKALGMEWIPPELRENRGEIEAALKGKLPILVKQGDIRGDLHIHSDFDLKPSHDKGQDSFSKILDRAIEIGYEYIGFAEHNPASKLSKKEIYELIKARNNQLDSVLKKQRKYSKIKVFKFLEVDILADGALPLDNYSFDLIDAAIVSIHSSFRQGEEDMSKRILSGLSHPKAKILGHPTGRLLLQREGVEADWGKIFKFCAARNKALEINAYPDRLDLPDEMVREAKKFGAKFIIGTDSHDLESLANIKYGVAVARRGWLTKSDVLNTMDVVEFKKWLYDYR
jgi:DNA polymerase (family 10)